jgi:hypothetical protein
MEAEPGPAAIDAALHEGIEDIREGALDAADVFQRGQTEGFLTAGGAGSGVAADAGVEVAEGVVAHRRRLALAAGPEDVSAFNEHGSSPLKTVVSGQRSVVGNERSDLDHWSGDRSPWTRGPPHPLWFLAEIADKLRVRLAVPVNFCYR